MSILFRAVPIYCSMFIPGNLRLTASKLLGRNNVLFLYYSTSVKKRINDSLSVSFEKNFRQKFDGFAMILLKRGTIDNLDPNLFRGEIFNFYKKTKQTPEADYVSVSPYYSLVMSNDNRFYELKPLENQYAMFCHNILLKGFLGEGYFNRIHTIFLLKGILNELNNKDSKFVEVLNQYKGYFQCIKDIKEMKAYIEQYLCRKNSLPLFQCTENTNNDQVYKQCMFLLNDVYNFVNLYRKMLIEKSTEGYKFIIFTIEDSLFEKSTENIKYLINNIDYNITVEGMGEHYKKGKEIKFDIKGSDEQCSIAFDFKQLKRRHAEKLRLIIESELETITEIIDVPLHIEMDDVDEHLLISPYD